MAVVRKVQSRVALSKKEEPKKVNTKNERPEPANDKQEDGAQKSTVRTKKYCNFCVNKCEPHYWDASSLRRYTNDRGKIIPRLRLGTCAKHQRRVTKEVKHARHLALLPFKIGI